MFTTHQYPFSVFPGQGFACGLGHFDQNNMLNNDIWSPTFPFSPAFTAFISSCKCSISSTKFHSTELKWFYSRFSKPPHNTEGASSNDRDHMGVNRTAINFFAATTPGHRWLHHHWTTKGMFPVLTVLARPWGFFFMTNLLKSSFLFLPLFYQKG